jgi:hypothetical protein
MLFVQRISRLTNSWNLAEAFSDVVHIAVSVYRIEERERKLLDKEENFDYLVLLLGRSVLKMTDLL